MSGIVLLSVLWDGQENTQQSENPDANTGQKYTSEAKGGTITHKSRGNLNKTIKTLI